MKRTIFLFFTLFFIFVSCEDSSLSESESSESSSGASSESNTSGKKNSGGTSSISTTENDNTSGESETTNSLSYDSSKSPNVFEISASSSSITIQGIPSGKTVFLTKTNPTSSTISSTYTRYVTSATGISLSNGDTESSGGTSSNPYGGHGGHGPKRDCTSISLNLALPKITEDSSRAASSSITKVTPAAYTQSDVGTATRQIYVDQDSSISTFKKESAVLRAVGEFCYVWVVSDNWTSSSADGEKINSEIAEKIASNFDAMYLKIRNVFGEESDELATNSSMSAKISMNEYSETGTIVNIVIYDIGKDYTRGTNSGDTVGYFYAKDYFYLSRASDVYKYSNKGKYFYVDGYFAVNYTSEVYSTLAHEFQHMIDFGVKSMDNGVDSSTAHNEMKSMLCEDIMYYTLCALDSDFSEDDSPLSRLPMFNRHYADIGLEYSSNSPEVYYSYANNYAFGAWLLRTQGGIPLLHEIATSKYVDEEAIVKALESTGTKLTSMEELLKEYTLACTVSGENSGFNSTPDGEELSFGDYEYSLESVDLWNLASVLSESYAECKDSTSYYKFDGPFLYAYNKQVALRPYGITLQKIGTASGESATIHFNTSGISSSQKVYLVVE